MLKEKDVLYTTCPICKKEVMQVQGIDVFLEKDILCSENMHLCENEQDMEDLQDFYLNSTDMGEGIKKISLIDGGSFWKE